MTGYVLVPLDDIFNVTIVDSSLMTLNGNLHTMNALDLYERGDPFCCRGYVVLGIFLASDGLSWSNVGTLDPLYSGHAFHHLVGALQILPTMILCAGETLRPVRRDETTLLREWDAAMKIIGPDLQGFRTGLMERLATNRHALHGS